MVKRGRVDRGRTLKLSWAVREGRFTSPGADNAVEAVEGPQLTAGGWHNIWDVGTESQGGLIEVRGTDVGDTEVDKQCGTEVDGLDIAI